MSALVTPGRAYLGCNEVLATLAGVRGQKLVSLSSLPLSDLGQRLMALRYFIANGATWLRFFAWEPALARSSADAPARVRELASRVERVTLGLAAPEEARKGLLARSLHELAADLERDVLLALRPARFDAGPSDAGLALLCQVQRDAETARALRATLRTEAAVLHRSAPRVADLIYLATQDLERLPATTVSEAGLHYVIVADKGEMGVRAVRVAIKLGLTPVVLHSERDDKDSLQVRLSRAHGGFAISLSGDFRESYANPVQMAQRIHQVFEAKFGKNKERELARAALYPGYGPLAENTAAIEHFRRNGIVFVGPMQDVVERAGDKRKFRLLAESIDSGAVVPGIVIDEHDAGPILAAIHAGHAEARFAFPGRLKAANGGGGRGQMVVSSITGVEAAVSKVLGEIAANGWDQGVMFEQNIPETVHLEVQVLRDRYGNTRHFGMRDCTEQRASQKIQEEAPPALLRAYPGLEARICALAVRIADEVGYVGACTVELMFKDGHFYLLEMNTRIQVEHPVTEEAHRIRRGDVLEPLDLVALQLAIANGAPIPFAQEDVVCTHVAREFRINAESWRADLKDSRDGKLGLFLPNGGVFDTIAVPSSGDVLDALRGQGVRGIAELNVRFDCGFEEGDKLVNKDPTFGKLIVAIAPEAGHEAERFELLRLASIEVLERTRIAGRAARPDGSIIAGSTFQTNLRDHVRVLSSALLEQHAREPAGRRHVNWLVEMLRAGADA